MSSKMNFRWFLIGLATALAAVAGCFDEPVPAAATGAELTQVYLKGKGLQTLTVDAVLADGQIYVTDDSVAGGHYTNLTAHVASPDPSALTYLNLDYNALTNIDAVGAFTGLKWLRLNNNKLSSLPDLSNLTELRRLYLRDNLFVSVPEALKPGALPQLDSLDLSGNPIQEVPDWLAQRKGLAHLSLSNTKIKKLPADLSAWQSLKSLQLGGLELESLEELKRIRAALPKTTVVF